jgi:capsular polysaccharide biosynthesis protein
MINCVFSPPGAAVVELASESDRFSQAAQPAAVRNQHFALVEDHRAASASEWTR